MSGVMRSTKYFFLQSIRLMNMSFWVIIYPLLLMILMYLPLSGIEQSKAIDLQVGMAENNPYMAVFDEIDVVDVTITDRAAGEKLVEDEKLTAYITDEGDIVGKYGTNNDITIVRDIMSQIKRVGKLGPQAAAFARLDKPLAENVNAPSRELSIYFYNIVAMFSLYGYFVSSEYTSLFQANQNALAARNSISPSSKWKGLAASVLASFFVITVSMILLLILSEVILKLNLIVHWGPSLLLLLAGMIFGIAWGLPFGAANIPEWSKILVGIAGSLFMSMLSGMMSMDLRQYFLLNAPLVLKLNPVSQLTEGFYRINVMNQTGRAFEVLGVLAAYAVIFIGITLLLFRKQTYKSL